MSRAPVELLQEYRRDQILGAARIVIEKKGYERASVDQIAKRAGLSRSTVYEYFSSKEEILKGCLADGRAERAEELARRIDAATGVEAQLAAFFEICLSRVDQSREFFRAIAMPLRFGTSPPAEGPDDTEFSLVIKDYDEAVDRILGGGFERGELPRRIGPGERDCLGTLIVGAMGARCRVDDPPPAAAAATRFARFALRGLADADPSRPALQESRT